MKIIKREIDVNPEGFVGELKSLVDLYKRNSPRTIGFNEKTICKEFGLKLTTGDYFKLMEECGLSFTLSFISFDSINKRFNEINNGKRN